MNVVERIFTIGVYGFSEKAFFQALTHAGVDTLCDIRQRRGLRGTKYSFANSTHLQQQLHTLGIKYIHLKELAPTDAVRSLQWEEDKAKNQEKRERLFLGNAFISEYKVRCLDQFSADSIIARIGNSSRPCFLCVETHPAACHRSLVASKLCDAFGVGIENLLP